MRVRSRIFSTTAALAFAAAAAVGSAGAGSAATTIVLPDCEGKPQIRPASVTLACGDGGVVADGLTWTGWGEPFAAARGTASVNDCTPNCAQGHDLKMPIVLIVDGRDQCPDGGAAYARLEVAWPEPGERTAKFDLPLRCGHP